MKHITDISIHKENNHYVVKYWLIGWGEIVNIIPTEDRLKEFVKTLLADLINTDLD